MLATLYYTSNSVFMERCHSGNHVWADKNAVFLVVRGTLTILYIFFG